MKFIVTFVRISCHTRVQSFMYKEHTAMWHQTNIDPTVIQYKIL